MPLRRLIYLSAAMGKFLVDIFFEVLTSESFIKRMPRGRVLAFAGGSMEAAKNCVECRECVKRCP